MHRDPPSYLLVTQRWETDKDPYSTSITNEETDFYTTAGFGPRHTWF